MSKYSATYSKLADFGRELLDKNSLTEGLPLISKYAKDVSGAQRCSIFMYDADKNEVWTTLADGIEKISIPADKGLVGQTIKAAEPVIENEAYSNPNFLSDIDKESGFKTKNIATTPIFNSQKEILGVLQLLNKDGGFEADDIKFMVFFSHYISGFLELSNLYEEIKQRSKK